VRAKKKISFSMATASNAAESGSAFPTQLWSDGKLQRVALETIERLLIYLSDIVKP
jgi:hypothetical protein